MSTLFDIVSTLNAFTSCSHCQLVRRGASRAVCIKWRLTLHVKWCYADLCRIIILERWH